MTDRTITRDIDGYEELQEEIAVLRKYAADRIDERGLVDRMLSRLHPKRLQLRLAALIDETPTTRTVRFVAAEGRLPPFQAGQYIALHVAPGGVGTTRPYSISSPPTQGAYYDLTIRAVADGFVSTFMLEEARVGDRFESSGPEGQFFHNPLFHGDDLVFLAGGSGITPFMSMIREATDRGLDRRIHLIYGSRHPEDVIFHDELAERASRFPSFSYTPVFSEPPPGCRERTGFITADCISEAVGDTAGRMVYVCGPEDMYRFVLPELERLGVPRKRIRREVFGPPADVTDQPGWPPDLPAGAVFTLTVAGGGRPDVGTGPRTVPAQAGEPILTALERAGIAVPNLCRSGECSLCRTRLVRGEVFQAAPAKVRSSDRRFGYIHACAAYPLGDLEIML